MFTYTNRRHRYTRSLLVGLLLPALFFGCASEPTSYTSGVKVPPEKFVAVFGLDPTADTRELKNNPILINEIVNSVTQELAKTYQIVSLQDAVNSIGDYDKNKTLGTVLHENGYPYAALATVHSTARKEQTYHPSTGMYSGPSESTKVSCNVYRTADNTALAHVIREATNSDKNYFQKALDEALDLETTDEQYFYGAYISCRDAIESIVIAQ